MTKKTTSKSQSWKLAEHLYADPVFKNDVIEIRHKLGIPKEGFESWEAASPYLRELNQEIMRLLRASGFPKPQLKPVKTEADYYTHLQERRSFAPVTSLDMAMKDLRKRYKLSRNWDVAIRNHILIGEEWTASGVTAGVELDYNEVPRVCVYVDEYARQVDLKKVWGNIQEMLDGATASKSTRLRDSANLQRDALIYELRISGMKQKDIVHEIEKTDYSNVSYQDIPKIIKRFKKRSGQ